MVNNEKRLIKELQAYGTTEWWTNCKILLHRRLEVGQLLINEVPWRPLVDGMIPVQANFILPTGQTDESLDITDHLDKVVMLDMDGKNKPAILEVVHEHFDHYYVIQTNNGIHVVGTLKQNPASKGIVWSLVDPQYLKAVQATRFWALRVSASNKVFPAKSSVLDLMSTEMVMPEDSVLHPIYKTHMALIKQYRNVVLYSPV